MFRVPRTKAVSGWQMFRVPRTMAASGVQMFRAPRTMATAPPTMATGGGQCRPDRLYKTGGTLKLVYCTALYPQVHAKRTGRTIYTSGSTIP